MCVYFILGLDRYGIFGAETEIDVRDKENSNTWYLGQYYKYIIFQIPNISALNSSASLAVK